MRHTFSQVKLQEMSPEDSFIALEKRAKLLTTIYEVSIDVSALDFLIHSSKRYLNESTLPSTPIHVLIQAIEMIDSQKHYGPLKVQALEKEIAELESKWNLAQHSNRDQAQILASEIAEKNQKLEVMLNQADFELQLVERVQYLNTYLRALHALHNQLDPDTHSLLRFEVNKKIAEVEAEKKPIIAQLEAMERIYTSNIDQAFLSEVIADLSNLPISRLMSDEKELLKTLESKLQVRVKGQDPVLKAVCDTIRRSRLGLTGDNRPRAVFLFVGPTGVGKTELAKALAEELFGDEDRMVRFDMSEYQSEYDHSRLLGASPGFVGYDKGGEFTEALKKTPYRVVLLDEFEKAHPRIADLFLQVFDDGRITDGQGNTVNCKEAIFMMTSNVGAETYDYPYRDHDADIEAAMRQSFRPEFRNRIDSILKFKPLDDLDVLREIAEYQLGQLKGKVERLFAIQIDWNPAVVEHIIEKGFNPAYGARPLRNFIESHLMTLIANALLDEQLQKGDSISFELGEEGIFMVRSEETGTSSEPDRDKDTHPQE